MSDCTRESQYNITDHYWNASYSQVNVSSSDECKQIAILQPDRTAWYYKDSICHIAPISTLSQNLEQIPSPNAIGGIIVCNDSQGYLGKFIMLLLVLLLGAGFFFYMKSCRKCNQ